MRGPRPRRGSWSSSRGGSRTRGRGRRTGGRWGNSWGGARREASGCATSRRFTVAAYIRTHPGSVPTVKQHLAAIRMLGDWLVRQPGPPGEPRRGRPRAEARRHQGGDAGPLAGGGEEAPRVDRHGRPGRAPGPGAALGHALQLRAGERSVGDAAAGLLRAGEPGLVEAPREGREAARRPGPPPGGRGPRRLRRGGRARRAEGGALPDRGPGGTPADGPGARSAARSGDDQAAGRGRGLPPSTCCHTFRATGTTAYLSNGGTLEHAQQIAGHASPKTTKLYDPTADTVTVDELERIVI